MIEAAQNGPGEAKKYGCPEMDRTQGKGVRDGLYCRPRQVDRLPPLPGALEWLQYRKGYDGTRGKAIPQTHRPLLGEKAMQLS